MAAKKKSSKTRASDSESVDAYIKNLKHPLAELVRAVRKTILGVNAKVGEEIKWNAPAFFFTGEMQDSALVDAVKSQLKHIHD